MLRPGKRPMSSMCPTIITDSQGVAKLVIGAIIVMTMLMMTMRMMTMVINTRSMIIVFTDGRV